MLYLCAINESGNCIWDWKSAPGAGRTIFYFRSLKSRSWATYMIINIWCFKSWQKQQVSQETKTWQDPRWFWSSCFKYASSHMLSFSQRCCPYLRARVAVRCASGTRTASARASWCQISAWLMGCFDYFSYALSFSGLNSWNGWWIELQKCRLVDCDDYSWTAQKTGWVYEIIFDLDQIKLWQQIKWDPYWNERTSNNNRYPIGI